MTLRERIYYLKAKYRIGFARIWHSKGFDDGMWAAKVMARGNRDDGRELAKYVASLALAELDMYVPTEITEAARRVLNDATPTRRGGLAATPENGS